MIGDRQRRLIEAIADAVLTAPGDSDSEVRRAAFEHARDSNAAPLALTPDLARFVGKVARHAYKVTDEDVEGLLTAGWSQDAVFEVIVATAAGAGRARLEHGLAALAEAAR